MIIQEDNRWKVVILLKKKKSGACVFWAPYFSKFFGGKIRRIWTDITYRTNNEKIGTCVLLSWRENYNFFLTILIIILNCPKKSQNIICLSFSPWFWQMSLSSDSQQSCKNTFVFRNRPFPQRNHSLPWSIADIQESVCKKWK